MSVRKSLAYNEFLGVHIYKNCGEDFYRIELGDTELTCENGCEKEFQEALLKLANQLNNCSS